jgi:hypothetical protein
MMDPDESATLLIWLFCVTIGAIVFGCIIACTIRLGRLVAILTEILDLAKKPPK